MVFRWSYIVFSGHNMEANMGAGRPKAELVLNDSEREQLQVWARRPKTAQALALRSRIILACSGGAENKVVAAQLAIAKQTVCKWRGRFLQLRLDGLLDAPRSGAPHTIDDARVDAVIAKTLETQPMNATHWSTRTMAKEAKLSQTAASRIWRAFGLQPHRQTFKLSTDPCSSRRHAISWACTSIRRSGQWCFALMRKARSRHSTGLSRFFHWTW
jgi:transposase